MIITKLFVIELMNKIFSNKESALSNPINNNKVVKSNIDITKVIIKNNYINNFFKIINDKLEKK